MPWVFFIILSASLLLRWLALDHIPGVSSDEAFSAVMTRLWLLGQPQTWLTPTQRLINPFYLAPTLGLQAAFSPSVILLRLPAFLSGVATVLLAFPLLRRALPQQNARIAAVWIACAPLLIIYSRVAWEPSQIPLASLLVTYFALKKNALGTALALAAAVLVHSICIFLVPIAVLPFAWDFWKGQRKLPPRWMLLVAGAALAVLLAWLLKAVPAGLIAGVPRPVDFIKFWQGWSRIFSGVLAFGGYGVKPGNLALAFLDVLFMMGLPIFMGWRFKRLEPRHRAFAIGIGLSVVALFIVGGQAPMALGRDRYCAFLAVPTLIALALMIPTTRRGLASAYVVALLALLSTGVFFFAPTVHDGGAVQKQYRAGPVDPKTAASQWIVSDAAGQTQLRIVAEDWWTYWVAYYFALSPPERPVEIRHIDRKFESGMQNEPVLASDEALLEFFKQGAYAIGVQDDRMELAISRLTTQGARFEEKAFRDYAGAPFVKVWKLAGSREGAR